MPAEDPPGTDKHIRFGKISSEIYEALVGIPGVKSVVLHTKGKKGEKHHWHIWWEAPDGKPITNQTWRNRALKLPALKDFSGNKDWSFRNHNSWEAWATYVCANLSHSVLLDYRDLNEHSSKAKIVVKPDVIPHTTSEIVVVKSKSRMRWDEKICHDAETRLMWKRDLEFSLASMHDGIAQKKVETQVTAFMRGRLNNNEGVKYARNLLYEFADEDLKEYIERKVWEKISWI